MRDSIKEKETFHFIWVTLLWKKVNVNIVHMSSNKKKHYLIVVRDNFFEWAETRALFEAKAWRIAKFLWKDVICKHDCFEKLTINNDSENKEILEKLVKRYRIKKMITSDYHSQINEMIKKDHKFLFDVLFKMSNDELKNWMNNLHVVLWINRFIVKFIIDLTSFYLQCDNESVLSIELKNFIWRVLFWQKIHIIEKLLAMRTRQLRKRNENMNEERNLLKRMRKQEKEYFDAEHFTIDKKINKNDLVFLHDIQHKNDRSINRKLKYKWRKSFRIKKIIQNKKTYLLQKLDETDLAEIFVENKIKKFHQRQSLKISSSVSSISIMNDHEFIDENDVMKHEEDLWFSIFNVWRLIVCDDHFLDDESILKAILRIFERRTTRIFRLRSILWVVFSLSFRREARDVWMCMCVFVCLRKKCKWKASFSKKIFLLFSLKIFVFWDRFLN